VTVYGYFSVNPNRAPYFYGVTGTELDAIKLWSNNSYYATEYQLPQVFDWDGNNVYIHVYEGRESVFTYFDNDTKSFKFYDQLILPEWEGEYKVEILIGDDHWLGSLT